MEYHKIILLYNIFSYITKNNIYINLSEEITVIAWDISRV